MLIADGSEAKIHRDIFDVGGRYEEGFSVGVLTGGSDLPQISDTAFSLSLSGTVKNWSLRIYQFLLTRTWNNWSDVGILHSSFSFYVQFALPEKILGVILRPFMKFFWHELFSS